MIPLSLFGAALLLAVSAFALRELGWRGVPVFVTLGALLLLGEAISSAEGLIRLFLHLGEETGLTDTVRTVLKILGLGYLTSLTAETCRALGEGAVASAVVTAGRLSILLLAVPFFEKLLTYGMEALL